MAEVDAAPTFGAELKDGFKSASTWVGNGIAWLDDIQAFYRERSVIEKEYSAKLTALAKRYFEKKAKKSASLSVGDTPAMTPGSLESASLTTWTTQLTTLEARADEHERYSNDLVNKVAEPLKYISMRFEELRKRHVDYAKKLEKERDASYADLALVKEQYDATCKKVEDSRKRSENAFQRQTLEMNNAKNTYLIAINVTNRQKEKYYHEYVPELMDSLQDLYEFRTLKLNGLWSIATQLEGSMLQKSLNLVDYCSKEITRNQPHLDSIMYIRHNMGAWQEPADKIFEASAVWGDNKEMVVDETAKAYLGNVLSKSKSQLGELRREVDKKRREVEALKRAKQKIREGTEQKDEVSVVSQMFAMQEELHQLDRRRLTAEVETSTIMDAVGGDLTLGAKNHNFKSKTIITATNCDVCGERIWGLKPSAFECRACGYTCHTRCKMNVPAECPGELSKEERNKAKQKRQEAVNTLLTSHANSEEQASEQPIPSRENTMNSSSSGYAASAQRSISGAVSPTEEAPPLELPASTRPTSIAAPNTLRKNRVIAPPPAAYISELSGSAPNGSGSGSGSATSAEQKGKMLYSFEAGGEREISVPEGRDVTVLEPDTGSGWIKVRAGYKEGMVPATYVELCAATPIAPQNTGQSVRPPSTYSNSGSSVGTAAPGLKKKGPAVAPRRGAKKLKYVEALYEYTAQSDAEHSMTEGERFVLIKEDTGDGWAEVEKGGVTKSVPANYIQVV